MHGQFFFFIFCSLSFSPFYDFLVVVWFCVILFVIDFFIVPLTPSWHQNILKHIKISQTLIAFPFVGRVFHVNVWVNVFIFNPPKTFCIAFVLFSFVSIFLDLNTHLCSHFQCPSLSLICLFYRVSVCMVFFFRSAKYFLEVSISVECDFGRSFCCAKDYFVAKANFWQITNHFSFNFTSSTGFIRLTFFLLVVRYYCNEYGKWWQTTKKRKK